MAFEYLVGDNADPSPYFNRVEQCRFAGWDEGIHYRNTNTLTVESCRFDVPPEGVGVAVHRGAHLTLVGNQFVGRGQSGVGVTLGDSELRRRVVAEAPHMAGNLFRGLAAGVRVEPYYPEHHFGATFGVNRLEPDGGGEVPPQSSMFSLAAPSRGVALGDDLQNLLYARFTIQDAPVGPATASCALGGENLLRQVSMGALRENTAPGAGSPWGWAMGDANGLRVTAVRPAAGGPRGPSLAHGVRVKLSAAGLPAGERGTIRLEQVLCAWQAEDPLSYLAMATRLAGRPVRFSCWIWTNIAPRFGPPPGGGGSQWTSGVSVGLSTLEPDRFFTNHHAGDGGWELLSGMREVSATSELWVGPLPPPPRYASASARFVVEIRLDSRVAQPPGFVPMVEVCTPCLGTGAFPGPPRAPSLTEDGGALDGPLVPAVGPTEVVTLSGTAGPGGAVRALPGGVVMTGDRRLVAARVWGGGSEVRLVGDGGRLVAQASAWGTGSRAMNLHARQLRAGEEIRLVPGWHKVASAVRVSLLLGLAPSDPDAPARGY